MPGGSIYVQQDPKFTGASPQWYFETYWREGAKGRRRSRAIKAAVGFAVGFALALRFDLAGAAAYALALAVVVAGIDWYLSWRSFAVTAVWRGKRRDEQITGKLLRRALRKRGYSVLDGRAIRGQASIDHLVIGPGGVWIVDNESWSPDTEIASYGGRLFFGEKYGTKVAKPLVDTATAFAEMLTRETRVPVTITPLLAVHCGQLPRGGMLTAEGLTLLKPGRAAKVITSARDRVLNEEQIELLARTAARELQKS
ncbi:nuclease-related domain-containing protein [Nonomuraea sp. NPDC050536]|uniref:nuclease-related domain-containing protein n=1 Tax=Nonomuraea sp. NPDC050536 TaxID=3364366 RepID=UPI0037CBD779